MQHTLHRCRLLYECNLLLASSRVPAWKIWRGGIQVCCFETFLTTSQNRNLEMLLMQFYSNVDMTVIGRSDTFHFAMKLYRLQFDLAIV